VLYVCWGQGGDGDEQQRGWFADAAETKTETETEAGHARASCPSVAAGRTAEAAHAAAMAAKTTESLLWRLLRCFFFFNLDVLEVRVCYMVFFLIFFF
jgi:hypothetical protein